MRTGIEYREMHTIIGRCLARGYSDRASSPRSTEAFIITLYPAAASL
jgi:hypothetical protein